MQGDGRRACLLPHHDALQSAQGFDFFGRGTAGDLHAGGGGVQPGVHAVGAEAVAFALDDGGHMGQKLFQRGDAQLQGLDIRGRWAGCGGGAGVGHGAAFQG